jgi:hypothetical protein
MLCWYGKPHNVTLDRWTAYIPMHTSKSAKVQCKEFFWPPSFLVTFSENQLVYRKVEKAFHLHTYECVLTESADIFCETEATELWLHFRWLCSQSSAHTWPSLLRVCVRLPLRHVVNTLYISSCRLPFKRCPCRLSLDITAHAHHHLLESHCLPLHPATAHEQCDAGVNESLSLCRNILGWITSHRLGVPISNVKFW